MGLDRAYSMRKVQRRIDTFAMDRVTQTNTMLLVGLLDPRNDDAWNAFHKRFRPLLIAYGRRRGLSMPMRKTRHRKR